jgi:hypothetical protein
MCAKGLDNGVVVGVATVPIGEDSPDSVESWVNAPRGVLPRFKGWSQHRLGDRSIGVR